MTCIGPDAASVWRMVAALEEVWVHPDERTLDVVGLRGFDMVLHSLEVEESESVVELSALIAFTPEAARRLAEPSEQPGIRLIGWPWRAEVRLQSALWGRPVVDRGAVRSDSPSPDHGQTLVDQTLARLQTELAAGRTSRRATPDPPGDQGGPTQPLQGAPYKALTG
jgi:hypothetical protein